MTYIASVTNEIAARHNNFVAANQWANRPASERFWNVQELRDHCKNLYDNSQERVVETRSLEVVPTEGAVRGTTDLALKNRATGGIVRLNNWSFGQVAARLGAPASYLRTLNPEDAALLLNRYGVERADKGNKLCIWRHVSRTETGNPISVALAVTSERYGRIPNFHVCDQLLNLGDEWRVPPARPNGYDPRARRATAEDVLSGNKMSLSIQEGDLIAPAGCYGDDRSIFAFMVNENRPIQVSKNETLFRGFYVQNSEVGASALKITVFDYSVVCGNHIIWGAKNLKEVSIRHVGDSVASRFRNAWGQIQGYMDQSADTELQAVNTAKKFLMGKNGEEVIEYAVEKVKGLTKKAATGAFDLAEMYADDHGDPRSAWGFAAGITRYSQTLSNTDDRDAMDRNVARVLQLSGASLV